MDKLKCVKCGADQFTVRLSGPHRRLDCAYCGKYVKFITVGQEENLKKNNQIVDCDVVDLY